MGQTTEQEKTQRDLALSEETSPCFSAVSFCVGENPLQTAGKTQELACICEKHFGSELQSPPLTSHREDVIFLCAHAC